MHWLALDTATERLSVALGGPDAVSVEMDVWAPRDHMARLLPVVERALAEGRATIDQVEGVIVGVGPGSLTGVRIGVAVAKGIARGAGCALVGIPTLDAVAQGLPGATGPILVVMDAARGEVYPMLYRWRDGVIERETGGQGDTRAEGATFARSDGGFFVMAAADAAAWAAARLGDVAERVLVTGDGLVKHRTTFENALPAAAIAPSSHWYPRASALMALAAAAGVDGSGAGRGAAAADVACGQVLPIYTRLSDAEEHERVRSVGDPSRRGPGDSDTTGSAPSA